MAEDQGWDADVIVVGTGPAGVSAAFPLLEAGMRVLALDGGADHGRELVPPGSYHEIRRGDEGQWRYFLGPRLEGLRPAPTPSPKFGAPASRAVVEGFADRQGIAGRNFTIVGSLAAGGLSAIWGAGLSVFDDDDLAEFPLTAAELASSYRRVAQRMGVSGFGDDDLATTLEGWIPNQEAVPLAENAGRLLARYARRRAELLELGFRLGRSRAAVLTEPRAGRQECALCDQCIWGCHRGALYSAVDDLEELRKDPNLDYRRGIASGIERLDGGYRLGLVGGEALSARTLVLAASTLATTRMILEMLDDDTAVPLLGTPMANFALFLPERLGAALSTREYSLGQISFKVRGEAGRPGDDAFGSLFSASGVPGAPVVQRMPLTRPAAIRLFRYLQPALLLGNCFLPGRFSANRAWRGSGAPGRLLIEGGTSEELGSRAEELRRTLGRAFRKLGAFPVPKSFSFVEPGQDLRYSGTLPMRAVPGPRETDRWGELFGAPGLFIVDMSVFPAMPAKHHTMTMMAIADRAGRHIAERWQ